MGKKSQKHSKEYRQRRKKTCPSRVKRQIKRALTLTTSDPTTNPFPSPEAAQIIAMSHEVEQLIEDIKTLNLKLQAISSALQLHNPRKPRTRQEKFIYALLKYLPGCDPVTRLDVFPSEKIKQLYCKALETISEMRKKRDVLRSFSETALGVHCDLQEVEKHIALLESETETITTIINTHTAQQS